MSFNWDYAGDTPIPAGGGSFTVYDYETVPGTSYTYTAQLLAWPPLVSLWSAPSGSVYGLYFADATNPACYCPTSAALQFTGDIDIQAQLACAWSTEHAIFISRDGPPSNRSWFFELTSGQLAFAWFSGGLSANQSGGNSSVTIPFADGQIGWVRVTRVASTGLVTYYTSLDGVTWTQLGTTANYGAGSLFAGTAPLYVGEWAAQGYNGFIGSFFKALVYSGINGTLVASPDFTAVPGYSFPDAQGNVFVTNGPSAYLYYEWDSLSRLTTSTNNAWFILDPTNVATAAQFFPGTLTFVDHEAATTFEPLGPRGTLIKSGAGMKGRQGSIAAGVTTQAAYQQLRAVLTETGTLLLQGPLEQQYVTVFGDRSGVLTPTTAAAPSGNYWDVITFVTVEQTRP